MIPRRMSHIWIGPFDPPLEWMQTWRDMHPDWDYVLYDNDVLTGRRWRCQPQILEYFRRGKWPGISDLMRYELLYEHGGFIAEADSVCLHPVDELLTEDRAYSVYEFPEGRTGMVSPFLACEPGNPVVGQVLDEMAALDPETMGNPWTTTGNGFLRRFFLGNRKARQACTIFPSHYFIPEHYKGEVYTGDDRIYARQLWGTTQKTYPHRVNRAELDQDEIARRRDALYAAVLARGNAAS